MKEKLLNCFSTVKSIFSNNKSLVLKCIAALIIVIAVIVVLSCFKGGSKINTIANSHNVGLVAKDGSWLYYVDVDDDEPAGIKKIKQNGKKSKNVADGYFYCLNVDDGYIYCIETDEKEQKSNLVKMKTNGKKKETLASNIDEDVINVVDKWVYYYKNGNLYRVNKSGEDRTKVSERDISYYHIDGKWMYYIYSKSGTDYIAKKNLDKSKLADSNDEKIIKDSDAEFEALYVKGKTIYYISSKMNKDYDYESTLYKVDKKGENSEKIHKLGTGVKSINMQKDKIYYITTEDYDEYEIKSIKYNGTEEETIKKDEYASNINVTGKWITYLSEDDDDTIIKMISTDGKKEKSL